MKKQTLLNYVLATIVVVLLFYIRTSGGSKDVSGSPQPAGGTGDCNYSNATGFIAAKEISSADARSTSQYYAGFAGARQDSILGGVISKATLDSLFCTGNFNGLAYRLGLDPNGRVGPKNSVFIIVSGVKVQYNQQGVPSIATQSSKSYSPNLWCPTNCANFD